MKSIALGTYELMISSTRGEFLEIAKNDNVNYIDTAISYYNEDTVRHLLKLNKNLKVISKIAPQMGNLNYDLFIESHIKELGVIPDIMLIHNNRCDWIETARKLESDERFNHIGVSNFSIQDLDRYYKEFNKYPEYIEFEINPQYTDAKLVNFCRINEIKIIAYCILGGKYNSSRYISSYTLPGLIKYAMSLSDIIILRGNSEELKLDIKIANKLIRDNDFSDIHCTDIDNKSIVPMTYLPQNNVGYIDKCKLISFDLYSSNVKPISNKATDELLSNSTDEFDEILNDSGLEFITDLRAYLFYTLKYLRGWNVARVPSDVGMYNYVSEFLLDNTSKTFYDIVIINENNEFSKIVTKGSKVKVLKYTVK